MNCPFCGKQTAAGARNCVHCGGPLVGGSIAPGHGGNKRACPSCNAPVQPGDIICVSCGTNLLTGQKVTDEKRKKERERKESPAYGRIILRGFAVLVGMAVLGGLGFLAVYLLQDPVDAAKKLARQGNTLGAMETLQKHIARRPDNRNARLLLGRLQWQSEQYAKAADSLEAAYRTSPADQQTGMMAVAAAGKIGGEEGRRRQAALLHEILKNSPENGEAWRLLALTLGAIPDFKGLEDHLKSPPGGVLDPSLGAVAGLSQSMAGDLESAERLLRGYTAAAPDNGDAMAALGFVLNLEGQPEAAAEALQKALDLNTAARGAAGLQLGIIHLRQGSNEKAMAALAAAKKELPNDPRPAFFHALSLEQTGLRDEALISHEEISRGGSAYAGASAMQLALLYLAQNLPDKAAASVKRAMELGVSSARLFTIQGRIHAAQNNMSEADQAFKRAMQLEPEYPPAYLEQGLLMVNRGDVPQGVAALEKYIQLSADDTGNSRRNEIELLVTQLKQSLQAS